MNLSDFQEDTSGHWKIIEPGLYEEDNAVIEAFIESICDSNDFYLDHVANRIIAVLGREHYTSKLREFCLVLDTGSGVNAFDHLYVHDELHPQYELNAITYTLKGGFPDKAYLFMTEQQPYQEMENEDDQQIE